MELLTWTILAGIALTLVVLGAFRPEETYFSLLGFGLFILLGAALLGFSGWSVEHTTGETTLTNHTYNASGALTSTLETTTRTTTEADIPGMLSFYVTLLGLLGFVASLFSLRTGGQAHDE